MNEWAQSFVPQNVKGKNVLKICLANALYKFYSNMLLLVQFASVRAWCVCLGKAKAGRRREGTKTGTKIKKTMAMLLRKPSQEQGGQDRDCSYGKKESIRVKIEHEIEKMNAATRLKDNTFTLKKMLKKKKRSLSTNSRVPWTRILSEKSINIYTKYIFLVEHFLWILHLEVF